MTNARKSTTTLVRDLTDFKVGDVVTAEYSFINRGVLVERSLAPFVPTDGVVVHVKTREGDDPLLGDDQPQPLIRAGGEWFSTADHAREKPVYYSDKLVAKWVNDPLDPTTVIYDPAKED